MIYVLKKSEYSVTLADTETFQSKDCYSGDLVEFLNNGGSIVNLNMFKPLGDSQISRFVLHYDEDWFYNWLIENPSDKLAVAEKGRYYYMLFESHVYMFPRFPMQGIMYHNGIVTLQTTGGFYNLDPWLRRMNVVTKCTTYNSFKRWLLFE